MSKFHKYIFCDSYARMNINSTTLWAPSLIYLKCSWIDALGRLILYPLLLAKDVAPTFVSIVLFPLVDKAIPTKTVAAKFEDNESSQSVSSRVSLDFVLYKIWSSRGVQDIFLCRSKVSVYSVSLGKILE